MPPTTIAAGLSKNGTQIASQFYRVASTNSMASVVDLVYMNGTTDYLEAQVHSNGGTVISGGTVNTVFTGSLVASGNGLISGTGAGVSAMSSLTDVTLTSPISNSLLVYDGTKWVNKLFQDTVSTTTMSSGWPDAIYCSGPSGGMWMYHTYYYVSGGTHDYFPTTGSTYRIQFTSTGTFSLSAGSGYIESCLNKTVPQLYATGQAFNFIGNSGAGGGALGDRITSGTLNVTANSNTAIVSLTTNGTTWGYMGSGGSYLPNLTTNALTVGGLTINSSTLVSNSAQVAFSVYRGSNQSVPSSTYTKILFTSKDFDTNNNFDLTTSRFTATVAGKYQFNASAVCSGGTYCYIVLYKNGTSYIQNGSSSVYVQIGDIIHLEAGDTVEAYIYNTGSTVMLGDKVYTRFSGILLNGGSGGSGGASALSGLTDVTLSTPAANSLLVYDGSKWVNKLFQDTVSTTSMVPGFPDAIRCSNNSSPGVDIILQLTYTQASGARVYRYDETNSTPYSITYAANGAFSTHSNLSAYDCVASSKSIATLYAEGKAFNFIGNNGAGTGGLGYAITSGTLSVTANSATSIVSLSTAGTTWGYLGSNGTYLPNLNSNAISATNISATTINGVPVSSLGGGASPTNVPAFRVHKNGTNQTVTASSNVKMTFSTKEFDTLNNFDTGTSRFTPKVAGNYLFNVSAYCYSATSCGALIYKNGVIISGAGTSAVSDPITQSNVIVPMNGSTDYVEAYVYMVGSTTLNGSTYYTYFEGSLLASGNGLVSGTGAGVSAMSSLTDVTLTTPAANSILVYDGSKWVNKFLQDTVSTTSAIPGWPDAILCTNGVSNIKLVYDNTNGTSVAYHAASSSAAAGVYLGFTKATGAYSTQSGLTGQDCISKSISQLYAEGKAFNFSGNSTTGGLGYAITSGTLNVTANSNTAIVSLTTNGTTWGYMGSGGSYLPNLNTTNLSATTINGVPVSSLGGGASPTNVPAFHVHKNGTNQSVSTGSWQKLTFSTKVLDTYTNYNTGTSRFTPTVAGNYLLTGAAYCTDGTACWTGIYKNGSLVFQSGATAGGGSMPSVSGVLNMNGTTDYAELYVYYSGGSGAIGGTSYYTHFSGSLLASGNGLVSGTGAGVSAMSSLTDVTLTSPAANSLLVYDGTKWVNKLFQDTVSTTTMKAGAPDAITCNLSGNKYILHYIAQLSNGSYYYRLIQDPTSSDYNVQFTSAGVYSSNSNLTGSDCLNKTFNQLYAEGKAFNFIGNNGASTGGLGYAITSGTLSVTANSATSIISLTTAGTTWGYLGSNASYIPNLTTNALTVDGLTINSSTLVSNSAQVAFSVHRNGVTQGVTDNVAAKILFTTKDFDTNNNFNTATSRFTPTVAGKYLLNAAVYCASNTAFCQIRINKNGVMAKIFTARGTNSSSAETTAILDMNGSSDYVEIYAVNSGGTVIDGAVGYTRFSGYLLNGGGGSGGSTSAAGSNGQIQFNTSGNFNAAEGLKWDDANSRLEVTGTTSTTTVQFADNPSDPCGPGSYGKMKVVNGRPYVCRQ